MMKALHRTNHALVAGRIFWTYPLRLSPWRASEERVGRTNSLEQSFSDYLPALALEKKSRRLYLENSVYLTCCSAASAESKQSGRRTLCAASAFVSCNSWLGLFWEVGGCRVRVNNVLVLKGKTNC